MLADGAVEVQVRSIELWLSFGNQLVELIDQLSAFGEIVISS